jgi:predicted helicase
MNLNNNEINQSGSDWDTYPPLINENGKNGNTGASIFKVFSGGVELKQSNWTDDLPETFLVINSKNNSQDFFCLSTNKICDVLFTDNIQCIPLCYYTKGGTRQDNITDWAFQLFNNYYRQNEPSSPVCYAGSRELREEFLLDIPVVNSISKGAIFQYVYAVLHHPAYRRKYELKLKEESPRIPLYDHFQQWATWGKRLMDLHINYQTVTPYSLERKNVVIETKSGFDINNLQKAILKEYQEEGKIEIDTITTLSGIPATAWEYRLGNRSAIECILDQYKDKKPGGSDILKQFSTYKFIDYKELVIDLLKKACTVSVETVKVVGEMP